MADLLGEAVLEIRADFSRMRSDLNQLSTTTESTLKNIETQAVSSANRSTASFHALGGAVAAAFVAAGGFAAVSGAVSALEGFAREADTARISAAIFARTLADNNQDAAKYADLVKQISSEFKVLPNAVQDSISVFLRAGTTLEDTRKALVTIGASATIAGANLEQAFSQGAIGFTQLRSELLNTSGIMVNASDATKQLTLETGKAATQLTALEKTSAFINSAFKESSSEINAYKSAMTGLQGATQDLENTQALLRQEIGSRVAPAFTSLTKFAADLTTEFTKAVGSSREFQVALGAFAGLAVTGGIVAGFALINSALVALPALAVAATDALIALSAALPLLAIVTVTAAVVTFGLTIASETAKINADVDKQIGKWDELAKQIGKTGAIARLVNAKQQQGSVDAQITAVQARIDEVNKGLDAQGPVGSVSRGAGVYSAAELVELDKQLGALQTQLGGLKRTIVENKVEIDGYNVAQKATVTVTRDLIAEARVLVLAQNEAKKGFDSRALLAAGAAIDKFTRGNVAAAAAISAVTVVIGNQIAFEAKQAAEREKNRIKDEAADKKTAANLAAISDLNQREAFTIKITAAVDNQNIAQLKLLATQLQQDESTARRKDDLQGIIEAQAKQAIVTASLANIQEQFNEANRRNADAMAVARGQTSSYTATATALIPTVKDLVASMVTLSDDALKGKLLEAINTGNLALEQAARYLIKFRLETDATATALEKLATAEAKADSDDAFQTQTEAFHSASVDAAAVLDSVSNYSDDLGDVNTLLEANNALLKGDRDLSEDTRAKLKAQNDLLLERIDILKQISVLTGGDTGPVGSAPSRIDSGSPGGAANNEAARSEAIGQLTNDVIKLYTQFANNDIEAGPFLKSLALLNTRADDLDVSVIDLAGSLGGDLVEKTDNALNAVYELNDATEELAGVVYNADGSVDVLATRLLKLAIAAGPAADALSGFGSQAGAGYP